jgi:hypothetical protein
MDFIGALLVLSCLLGLILIALCIIWLVRDRPFTSFKKIAITFVCLGALIPGVISPVWIWSNKHFGAVSVIYKTAETFWPTSIALMALDRRSNWRAVAFVYAFSILANVGLYGAIGFLLAGGHRYATRLRGVRSPAP